MRFIVAVPRGQNSQAFEKPNHQSWSSWSYCGGVQRGHFGIPHGRGEHTCMNECERERRKKQERAEGERERDGDTAESGEEGRYCN